MVKIELTNRHDIYIYIYIYIYYIYMQWPSTDRDTKIVGHVPYNLAPKMSAFLMRKHLQKSQEPKSTGELAMVWKSHVYHLYGPNVMMTKWSWLSLYLLMDDITCVIVTLLNGNRLFKINGCGLWLFLEVNLYCFYSLGSWLLVVGWS